MVILLATTNIEDYMTLFASQNMNVEVCNDVQDVLNAYHISLSKHNINKVYMYIESISKGLFEEKSKQINFKDNVQIHYYTDIANLQGLLSINKLKRKERNSVALLKANEVTEENTKLKTNLKENKNKVVFLEQEKERLTALNGVLEETNKSLQTRVTELEQSLEQQKLDCDGVSQDLLKLKRDYTSLIENNTQLEQKLKELSGQNLNYEDLATKYNTLQEEIQNVTQEKDTLSKELDRIKEKVSQQEQEKQILSNNYEKLQEDLLNLQGEKYDLLQQIEQLNQTIQKHTLDLNATLSINREQDIETIKNLKTQLQEKDEEIQNIKTEIAVLEEEKGSIDKALKDKEIEVETLQKDLQNLEESTNAIIQKLNEQIEDLKKVQENIIAEKDLIEGQLTNLKEDKKQQEQEYQEEQENYNKHYTDFEATSQKNIALESELQTLQQQYANLETEYSEIQQKEIANKEIVLKLKEQVETLTTDKNITQEELTKANTMISDLNTYAQAKEKIITELQIELKTKQVELEEKVEELKDLKTEISTINSNKEGTENTQLAEETEVIKHLKEEIATIMQKLGEKQLDIDNLQQHLKQVSTHNYEVQIQAKEQEINQLKEQVDNLEKNNTLASKTYEEINILNGKIEDLEVQLQDSQCELKEVIESKEDIEGELSATQLKVLDLENQLSKTASTTIPSYMQNSKGMLRKSSTIGAATLSMLENRYSNKVKILVTNNNTAYVLLLKYLKEAMIKSSKGVYVVDCTSDMNLVSTLKIQVKNNKIATDFFDGKTTCEDVLCAFSENVKCKVIPSGTYNNMVLLTRNYVEMIDKINEFSEDKDVYIICNNFTDSIMKYFLVHMGVIGDIKFFCTVKLITEMADLINNLKLIDYNKETTSMLYINLMKEEVTKMSVYKSLEQVLKKSFDEDNYLSVTTQGIESLFKKKTLLDIF